LVALVFLKEKRHNALRKIRPAKGVAIMGRQIILVAFISGMVVCLSNHTKRADACCTVYRMGEPVVNADQTVIIVWDAATKTQHFIRQASFQGDAEDFGFLVPSPTQPELSESGDDAFGFLRQLTAPEIKRASAPIGCGCSATSHDAALTGAWNAVKVLEEKLVAGFNAAVLETRSSAALVQWLQQNGYLYSPVVEAWAKPYLEAGWKITALKVAKAKDSTNKKTSAAALRMSFKTETPLFPYREPAYKGTNEKVGAKNRLLRIYLLAESRYEGEFAKQTPPWSGHAVWAGKIDAAARRKILEHLKLPETTGPTNWWLTEFEDQWSYQPAAGDVYFRPSANQDNLRRPIHYEYSSTRIPNDGAIYALLTFAAFSSLLTRWRRGKPSQSPSREP
jgi:Uncharacterized protein conserved in bacteria (DUF2330)